MGISFPAGEHSVLKRKCVAFGAEMDGIHVVCRVAFEALMELPDGNRRHHLTTFRLYRPTIEARVVAMIREGRLVNRELLLLPNDLRHRAVS